MTRRYKSLQMATTAWMTTLLLVPVLLGQSNDMGNRSEANKLEDLSLEQLLNVKVSSAALHQQTLKDAPANVTVITAADLRRFGCRTFAEALAYVPGFYFTPDHTYTYLGARGFALPGDYDTRLIVMIDGHNIADNILGQSTWFGNDFPLDMDLVDRIEVVHGTSSALYGSNGMLATINVITRRSTDSDTRVRFETDSLGERKTEASTAIPLGKGANLLFSTSVFNNSGAQSLYFSEFDSPGTNFGRAVRMDGEKGFHGFIDLTWGNWDIIVAEGDRIKQQPISWAVTTVFNDRGTTAEDSLGFIDARYTKNFDSDRVLTWQTSYDSYRYRGIYHYYYDEAATVVGDNREHDYGDWLGTKLSYRMPDLWSGHLTTGVELKTDLRALINVLDVAPDQAQILRVNQPDRYVGAFAQQEWALGKKWELSLGARFDWSWLRRDALSPRAALIYQPSSKTNVKLLVSRGFSNPSTYNMFYDDNGLTQVPNPALRPEFVNTFEVDVDRQVTRRVRASVSAYRYMVSDLIQQIYLPDGVIKYVNQGHVDASGATVELAASLPQGLEIQTSLELQRATLGDGGVLPNSPGQVGKIRASMPLWRNRFTAALGVQALGQRSTYAGATVSPAILPEAVVSTKPFAGGFQLSAGVKNLSNSFYRDPVGLTPTVDTIIGNGRSYYFILSWSSAEKRLRGDSNQLHQ